MSISILSVQSIRAAESQANEAVLTGDSLMTRAGRALALRMAALFAEWGIPPGDQRVTFLIGPGNNGGDGLLAGHRLAVETGAQVCFYLLEKRPVHASGLKAVIDAGLPVTHAADDPGFHTLDRWLSVSQIVVDALYGIGARLPLPADAHALLTAARATLDQSAPRAQSVFADGEAVHPRRPYVLAVDCPSGVNCDTGEADEGVLPANETMTMIAAKPGLLLYPAAEWVGRLSIAALDLPQLPAFSGAAAQLVTADDVASWVPVRHSSSHKGTHGRVLIIGGSANYPGAPALAARAAYRAGAGLVTAGVPDPLVDMLAGSVHEATWLPLPHDLGALTAEGTPLIQEQAASANTIVVGMGIGRDTATRALIHRLLGAHANRSGIGFAPVDLSSPDRRALSPLLLDADALVHLSTIPDWPSLLPPGTILTPHPGEMARLCGRTIEEVNARRWELAREMAATWNVTLLLKGAHTVVCDPTGDLLVLPFKTSALATAGTGDVLAGMIGALRAAGVEPLHAAAAGAWLHGKAGLISAARLESERAVCAGDVVDAISAALKAVGR